MVRKKRSFLYVSLPVLTESTAPPSGTRFWAQTGFTFCRECHVLLLKVFAVSLKILSEWARTQSLLFTVSGRILKYKAQNDNFTQISRNTQCFSHSTCSTHYENYVFWERKLRNWECKKGEASWALESAFLSALLPDSKLWTFLEFSMNSWHLVIAIR